MLQSVQATPAAGPAVPAGTAPDPSSAGPSLAGTSAAAPSAGGPLGAPRLRRLPSRLRVFFLRQLRACGRVGLAAERTGITPSTLYRWRAADEDFRAHWDSISDQRRHKAEDKLMQIIDEGEKAAVFHKGQQVGWRESHTARAAIALLGYLDRVEKVRRADRDRGDEGENSSHYYGGDRRKNYAYSGGWQAASARRIGNDDEAEEDLAPTPEPVSVPSSSPAVSSNLASEPVPSDQERASDTEREWDAYVDQTRAELAPEAPERTGGKKKRPRAGDGTSRHIVPQTPPVPPVLPVHASPPAASASPAGSASPTGSASEAFFIAQARRVYDEMNGIGAPSGPNMLPDDWKPYQ
ncbi:MAG: hypothetical protein PSV46_19290 [Reyranella sp.]|nr:hypothetical protein [Reyranella sp.]